MLYVWKQHDRAQVGYVISFKKCSLQNQESTIGYKSLAFYNEKYSVQNLGSLSDGNKLWASSYDSERGTFFFLPSLVNNPLIDVLKKILNNEKVQRKFPALLPSIRQLSFFMLPFPENLFCGLFFFIFSFFLI